MVSLSFAKTLLFVSAAVFAILVYLMAKRNGLNKLGCLCAFGTLFSVCGIGAGTLLLVDNSGMTECPLATVFGIVLSLGIIVYGIYVNFASTRGWTESDWDRESRRNYW